MPEQKQKSIAILILLNETYRAWHDFLVHLPKLTRFTLGTKIDNLLTDLIELSLTASYMKSYEKLSSLKQFSKKFDLLKYFVTLLWQIKGIDNRKYAILSDKLGHIGRMLGAWIKSLS